MIHLISLLVLGWLMLGVSQASFAEETSEASGTHPHATPSEKSKGPQPILSPKGKLRLKENIEILKNNIQNLENQIATAKSNQGILEADLKDLETLENEHQALKNKFDSYLVSARQEFQKNQQAYAKIETQLRGSASGKTPSSSSEKNGNGLQKDSLEGEREERLRWKADAEIKLKKAEENREATLKSLRDVQSRRVPMENQMKTWSERQNQYQTQLEEALQKKNELEKLSKL